MVEEFAYDAWGKRIYTDEPGFNNDLNYQNLCRGYTGHEHLPEFGLINMNGRVYDPLLGRFLSPDNYVQLPFFTQNYNRFAYCLNNPLIYTDPTGQSIVGDAFKWIKKNTWDAVWDGLNNFAQWADQNGIPAAGGGYNSAHGTYHYMGNSGNVYHNQFGNNYEGKVEQAVYTARQVADQSYGGILSSNDLPNNSFQGKISQWNPSMVDKWSETTNFFGKLSYDLVDGIWVTGQSFVLGPRSRHLNGSEVSGSDRVDGFVNTASWGVLVGELSSFKVIKGGVYSSRFGLRLQSHTHSLNPIGGRGMPGSKSISHFNINEFHIIHNPKNWQGWSNFRYLPFRF